MSVRSLAFVRWRSFVRSEVRSFVDVDERWCSFVR